VDTDANPDGKPAIKLNTFGQCSSTLRSAHGTPFVAECSRVCTKSLLDQWTDPEAARLNRSTFTKLVAANLLL